MILKCNYQSTFPKKCPGRPPPPYRFFRKGDQLAVNIGFGAKRCSNLSNVNHILLGSEKGRSLLNRKLNSDTCLSLRVFRNTKIHVGRRGEVIETDYFKRPWLWRKQYLVNRCCLILMDYWSVLHWQQYVNRQCSGSAWATRAWPSPPRRAPPNVLSNGRLPRVFFFPCKCFLLQLGLDCTIVGSEIPRRTWKVDID